MDKTNEFRLFEIKNRINSGDTEGAIQKCDELVASDQEEESENTTDSQVFQVFLPLVISLVISVSLILAGAAVVSHFSHESLVSMKIRMND